MNPFTTEDVLMYLVECDDMVELEKMYLAAEDRLEELGYFNDIIDDECDEEEPLCEEYLEEDLEDLTDEE
jgi:hypothetical protein